MFFYRNFLTFCVLFVVSSLVSQDGQNSESELPIVTLNGVSFPSQVIPLSKVVKIWLYSFAREDIAQLRELSQFGFESEDDFIFLVKLFYTHVCRTNMQYRMVNHINLQYVMELEQSPLLVGFKNDKNKTLVSKSEVVSVKKYRILKSQKGEIAILKKAIKDDPNLIDVLFLDVGFVSLSILRNAKLGDVFVRKGKKYYEIYIVTSTPSKQEPRNNSKVLIKDCLSDQINFSSVYIFN